MHTIRDKLGEFGANIVTTTGAVTGTWFAIQCLHSIVIFATLTELGVTRTGTIASVTLPANAIIYGAFTNFTLTTGSVRAYKVRDTTANP